MPKTFGLSFMNDAAKTYCGVAADNHLVYDLFGGLPKYTLTVVGITSLFWIIGIGCNKIKKQQKKKYNNTIEKQSTALQTKSNE